MADHYRKIELQSPEDLQYLIANVRRVADERIEKDLPPLALPAGQKDELKGRVEELVHDYITRVFTSASPNISINGLDVNPSIVSSSASEKATETEVQVFEAVDGKLQVRTHALIAEEEELIEEIARLKREMPGVAVEHVRTEYREVMDRDDVDLAQAVQLAEAKVQRDLAVSRLDRQEDVEASWRGAVAALKGLSNELPGTVAKTRRAERAADYVAAPERKN
ncbi:hypothetical protein PVAG01_03077 [Phlyctema vagabunda]|uniref:Uncharacterized protein n=1 Tax=Phlyctema vagabunda TaxID=108571 RepID=A0ABR4PSH0_9HELO